MANGGRRPGAGRKPKPKIPKANRNVAAEVFAEIDKTSRNRVKRWLELLDSQPLETMRYLTDRDEGRALQRQEDKIVFDPDQPLKVLVEHIGGTSHKAAAKTK